MGLPEDDRNPHRHAYGDYTHDSANGRYRFEWTPFRPAIEAWENAERYLKAAIDNLVDAQQLPGFALNGLSDEHAHMMGALKVLVEDAQACHGEAIKVVKVLDVANTDYANANEASLEQYQQLMGMVDLVRTGQTMVNADREATEIAADQKSDKDIGPFD
jgi:hypothetical protein